ncbi:MAG: carbon monoxide dehydrogenase, partial [Elusimicrobiota bacterium]|nr:carbon monoxide dehydrogenase [Elusimicrobiota bacterium]
MVTELKIHDEATAKVKKIAEEKNITTVWERYLEQLPQCGFGLLGLCCKNCNFGPCRIDPFSANDISSSGGDKGSKGGICGADADVISARNLLRHIAGGCACHSD